MKKLGLLLLTVTLVIACKKEKTDVKPDGDYPAKLTDIVVAKSLDEAVKLGFPIHLGDVPPNITGRWDVDPFKFEKHTYKKKKNPDPDLPLDSIWVDDSPYWTNYGNESYTLHVASQNGTTIETSNGRPVFRNGLTSEFIMGSGNDFTYVIHYSVWGNGINFSYYYVTLISGTKDGDVLRNLKFCNINLPKKSNDGYENDDRIGGFIQLASDGDKVSEKLL